MNTKFSRWQYFISFLFPKVIDKTQSKNNPYLEVAYSKGKLVLNTTIANYSYGGLHKVFQIAFKKINLKSLPIKNVLILGFGAGSVASIIYDELNLEVQCTGIEKDEMVIKLAKKYFNTDRFNKLNIICADAYDYLESNDDKYDLIVIDIYQDITVPEKFETNKFIELVHNHLSDKGLMVFNKVAATQKLFNEYLLLRNNCASVFKSIESFKALGINRVIVGYK
jgi:spermidine synthase